MVEPTELAPLLAVLRDLVGWWKAGKVPGVVIGGLAASLLGRPRLTRDVDALVLVEEANWGEFMAAGLSRIIHEKCLKKHRVSAKMLLSLNKQLLGKDTLWKQSAITSSSLKAFFPRKWWPILPGPDHLRCRRPGAPGVGPALRPRGKRRPLPP